VLGLRIGLGWAKSHSSVRASVPCSVQPATHDGILHNKVSVAKAVNVTVLPLENAPRGYNAFDKGAAEKFVWTAWDSESRRAAAELVGAQS